MMGTMATSICPVCLAVHPNTKARNDHMAVDHAGHTLSWAGNVATLTAPDGTARSLTRRDFRTMRETARAAEPPRQATPEPPQQDPSAPTFTGGGGPTIARGVPRVEQVAGRRVMTRGAVSEAFTREQFADLLREVSQILSDADGAGPAGVFSISEATLLSVLLHDQLVDLILARFDGDVTRFRAGAAILIILLGKGRVHMVAIQRGGLKGTPAPMRPIATVPAGLPVAPARAPEVAAPWATAPAAGVPAAPVVPAPEPPAAPVAPAAPAADTGPVLNRESAVDRIFHQ